MNLQPSDLVGLVPPSITLLIFALTDMPDALYQEMPKYDGSISSAEQVVIERSYRDFDTDLEDELPSSYEEYLLARNPRLTEEISDARSRSGADIVLISAPAGYGKTGLVTHALAQYLDRGGLTQRIFSPKDYCGRRNCSMKEDLYLTQDPVSRLPDMSESQVVEFVEMLISSNEHVVVVDGLDEVHTDSVAGLMYKLKEERDRFIERDIVLLTRPEIVDELDSDNFDRALAGVETVNLDAQRIARDALSLRVRNYLDYVAGLTIDTGSPNCDERSVCQGINDEDTIDDVSERLREAIVQRPYLAEMLRMAVLSSALIDAQRSEQFSLGEDDFSIRSGVLNLLLERNSNSHNRPDGDSSPMYINALVSVATNVVPDEDGYFDVPALLSAIHAEDNNREFSFTPRDVLQRSGIVSVRPLLGNGRMRFEPIWIQSVLAERSSETTPEYIQWKVVLLGLGVIVLGCILALMVRWRSE